MWIFCLICLFSGVNLANVHSPFDLEIISIIPCNISVGVALPFTGAALRVAEDAVNAEFLGRLNLTVTLLYQETDRVCEDTDAHAPLLLAEYYNKKALGRCVAVVGSACGGLSIAPFLAKEWDVLLFSNSLVASTSISQTVSPTSIGMVASYESIAASLLNLFRIFQWLHVTMLLDAAAATDFYFQVCQSTKTLLLTEQFSDFRVDGTRFTLADTPSVHEALKFANARSRVFVMMSHTSVAIKLMRFLKTDRLFIPGDQVFVVLQPTQQAAYGAVSLFDNPDVFDVELFRSTLYLTTYVATGGGFPKLNQQLAAKSQELYGTALQTGLQPLDVYLIRETYNSVRLFAALVNDSLDSQPWDNNTIHSADSVCGGGRLRSLMTNRTFRFPSGPVFIDANGYRHTDLLLYTFHPKTLSFQVVSRYDAILQRYLWDQNVSIEWLTGKPPLDIPPCGFSGNEGPCLPQGSCAMLVARKHGGSFTTLWSAEKRSNSDSSKSKAATPPRTI
ncbi:hypothetical protein BV898_08249 [Hypsibius exemplaris]|uniref:Receptor ligand binding region domain-containing protein n=1 Tax=Hypsibius exemplaris TaxID=2072580 RepID=A0A1W0WQZ4_HYPEX|nr:hypothetical protein BV898_08249 [Hypsibius exemplaris]